jgi:uncharacterized protein (TIGR03435 family)
VKSKRSLMWVVAIGIWPIFCQRSPAQSGNGPQATASLSFDVVSIRRNTSGKGLEMHETADGFVATNMAIQPVILFAYKLRDPDLMIGGRLLPGAPGWINSEKYDIRAKISPSDLGAMQKLSPEKQSDQKRLMLQSMLADRFKFKVRNDAKPMPCYALVVSKNGPRIKEAASSDPALPDGKMFAQLGHVEAQGVPMSQLAFALAAPLHCPVQDKTGLTGRYDFALQYSPDVGLGTTYGNPVAGPQNAASQDASGPSLFTAIREQLGLKLIPVTIPIEGIFIERIERPSAN